MNILHIAPYYPSVNAMHAGGVAMGHEIETLKKMGHNIYILSYIQKEYDSSIYEKEKSKNDYAFLIDKKAKFINIIKHFSTPVEFATRANRKFLVKILQYIDKYNIDYIHAEYTAMLWYTKIKKLRPNVKFIEVLHDVSSQGYSRKYINAKKPVAKLLYKIEVKRIKRFERINMKRCDAILSFSEKDKKIIKQEYGLESIAINTYFNQSNIIQKRNKIKREQDGFFSICFMGQMGRKENHEAAVRLINIFKHINRENKKLYIIGTKPREELLAMASDNVIITGFVEDIEEFILKKCDVACFPLMEGAGIKIKVLECLALGIPVITNQIGAEGIDESGKYIQLADSDEEFEVAIKTCSRTNNEYLQKFDLEFSWCKTEKAMEEIYGENK